MSNNKEWEKEFVEKGADLEHDRWARWQKYMFSKCYSHKINSLNCETRQYEDIETGGLVIPKHLVERWFKQIDTPYAELSEEEKESDRKETRNYIPLIEDLLQIERQHLCKELEEIIKEIAKRPCAHKQETNRHKDGCALDGVEIRAITKAIQKINEPHI